MCSGLNPVGYLGNIWELRFLLGCVGLRAAGATLGLHLWLPKTQQYLQVRIAGFFPLHPVQRTENVCLLGDTFAAGQ